MPDDKAQIPTPDEIIGKGKDKLVELRPRALPHLNANRGRYANLFAGWRAQAALLIRRLADQAKNGRLAFAAGEPLSILAASEFDTLADVDATKAVGQVLLTRAAGRDGGTIRRGARFSRSADTSSQRLWQDATFESAVDVVVAKNDTTVTIPLVATREGPHANRPSTGATQAELEIADDIFDRAAWTVTAYEAGGGADAAGDADIKRYAAAYAQGRYGPNERAAIAGAFRAGVRHVIAFDDVAAAALQLYIADSSWAGSTRWANLVRQRLYDDKFVGFGCKVNVAFATNQIITIEATASVRSPAYLAETSPLEAAIQAALRSYFDDRPDWNRWKLDALRGIVARADRRLLACPTLAVKALDGTTVSEPTTSSATHYMLLDNGARITFQSPS